MKDTSQGRRMPQTAMDVTVPDVKAAEYNLSEIDGGLQLIVNVPKLESMKGVNLDVTEMRASLSFPSTAALKPLQVSSHRRSSLKALEPNFQRKATNSQSVCL